jgi:hypothetical protein
MLVDKLAKNVNSENSVFDGDKTRSCFKDHTEAYIETATGGKFHFMAPTEDEVSILDIAHALSNQCRYTGHCARFYSVAEHSVLVASLVPPEWRIAALLHDASEAYLTDVAAPVKPFLSSYKDIELGIMKVIAKKFKFLWPPVKEIKHADLVALLVEARQLMPSGGEHWRENSMIERDALPKIQIACMPPTAARLVFLRVFEELTGEQVLPRVATPTKQESKIIMSATK